MRSIFSIFLLFIAVLVAGVVKNKIRYRKPMGFCGTGEEFINSGTYRFNLSYYENIAGYKLWWGRHDRGLPK